MRYLFTVSAIALSLALSGCAGIKLTDIAAAACKAQEAANVAGKIAESLGQTELAARFAEASRLAGLACAW